MLGEGPFSFRSPFDDFVITVVRGGKPLSPEELELGRRAALELRLGLERRDPGLAELAQFLESRLFASPRPESRRLDASLESRAFLGSLARTLEEELLVGRLRVTRRLLPSLGQALPPPVPELPPAPQPRESTDFFFEVRFVDEIGQALSGIPTEFDVDGSVTDVSTNAAGIALFEGAKSSTARIAVTDVDAVAEILEPRWQSLRPGKPPKSSNQQELVFFGDEIGPLGVKAVVPHTVVLKPPLGKLFVELFDKTGRVRHAGVPYTITGPTSFEGETDEAGRLLHEGVLPGDYQLSFELEFFEDADRVVDSYTSPLVVLPAEANAPEPRMLGVAPRTVLARLKMLFNTNKAFLLPGALPGLLKLRDIYADNNPSELLVVGHADTTAGPKTNDPLSLERAEATVAYLKDDVDAWLAFYGTGIAQEKRWGAAEDRMMLLALPDFATKPEEQGAVTWFQETRKLKVDGKAGPETRRRLITEYMGLDGTSLAASGITINALAHGCGENFPLDDSGDELDAAPADSKRDPTDRRVELFFFEPEFGIVPKPPGKNSAAGSAQYPAWRDTVVEIHEFDASAVGPMVTFAEVVDSLFRTNSAVVLPEGEAPSKDTNEHESLSAVGIFATVLRFNQEHEGKSLFVAGHTDTTASAEFNQTLSEERAEASLALLLGGEEQRENWKRLCDGRHTVADYKQILAWAARALSSLGFDCDPGKIDDNAATGVEPVRRFQSAYNRSKVALGASAADLALDGAVGPLTWGAIFDCYEFALAGELGVDAAGLSELRALLVFVDDERKALGFSEHFPIEELGVDNFRSQANRRVEILLFDPGEEPDLQHAEEDPGTSELYLPGVYERVPISSADISASFVTELEVVPDDSEATPVGDADESIATADRGPGPIAAVAA